MSTCSTELTDKQLRIFRLIYERARDTGIQPTIREIGNEVGISSTNGIISHLKALQRKGYLLACDGKQRCVILLRRPDGSPFNGFADKEA